MAEGSVSQVLLLPPLWISFSIFQVGKLTSCQKWKKVSWINQDVKQPSVVCLSLKLPQNFPQVLVSWKAGQWPKPNQMPSSLNEISNTNGNSHTNKVRFQGGANNAKTDFKTSTAHLFAANCLGWKKIYTWTTLVGLPQISSLPSYVCSLFLWYYHL